MAKIYIETNGCSHNFSDSEHMAGQLVKDGHEIVQNEDSADLVLFNTCTVKTPTEHAFFHRLKEVEFKKHSIVGTSQLHKIGEVVNETINGRIISLTKRENHSPLLLPRIRGNPL